MVASFVASACLFYVEYGMVSTGVNDRLWAGASPWYATKLSRLTQPCIPPASLNQVTAQP